ncbi:hypothetical protein GSY69_13675 [Brevibacterium sp. 5221]|uniref:Uncharacterized protein n=1 Tax=Brevibacterium rongguiense TaxID=2695267 RepID=A0A6N9HA90_9MICO|nr:MULTISPECIES: hypothetical protein [Brevibacterium]MYM20977.1 hypothetical protein [Brevibacterium rongguiense]WAL39572.1 hypothetical protein BRM1_09875 [Brevibacterium sp. BRM-1]
MSTLGADAGRGFVGGMTVTASDMNRVHRSAIEYGYGLGYADGYTAGEQAAALSDDEFLAALARRVRAADVLEDHLQQTLKATLATRAANRIRSTRKEAA